MAITGFDANAKTYSIEDTAAALLAVGAAQPITGAATVTVTGGTAGELSVANHGILAGLTTTDTWAYNLKDTTTAVAGAASGVLNGATNIVTTGSVALGAADTIKILAATNTGTTTIAAVSANVNDTLSFIFDATGNDTIASLSVVGFATITQATSILALLNSGNVTTASYQISDTIANANGKNFSDGWTGLAGVALTGRDGDQTVTGSAGADTFSGGAGNDIINGGGSGDIIWGNVGADDLTGGEGNDGFNYGLGDASVLGYANAADSGGSLLAPRVGDTFTGTEVIRDLVTGDVLVIHSNLGLKADVGTPGTLEDNEFLLVAGSYAGNVFTVAATGPDTLLTYDADSGTAGVQQEAIVLVGVSNTEAAAIVPPSGNGTFTMFGNLPEIPPT